MSQGCGRESLTMLHPRCHFCLSRARWRFGGGRIRHSYSRTKLKAFPSSF